MRACSATFKTSSSTFNFSKSAGVKTFNKIILFFDPGVDASSDTYLFDKQSSDLELLARAHRAMQRKLDAEWESRAPGLPYRTPGEALTMASIIEKETGREADRQLVATVFVNRLRQGMLLQTDPTVIYGLGDKFDGNLRKRDLQTDTPYNTYLRPGLPPTPISMPGQASLHAALNPAITGESRKVSMKKSGSIETTAISDPNEAR